jgi:hypothetical protein
MPSWTGRPNAFAASGSFNHRPARPVLHEPIYILASCGPLGVWLDVTPSQSSLRRISEMDTDGAFPQRFLLVFISRLLIITRSD